MKTNWGTLVVIVMYLMLFNALAHCQATTGVQPANGNTLVMAEHPRHADVTPLVSDGVTIAASGTRPLSDFPETPKQETPLGDVARYYRTHKYVPMEDTGENR
jgi:hypothetical protein